tara:strand:- start:64474 stop:65427 length:954 start_codon:yes stop_codon:yes gene_type:complete
MLWGIDIGGTKIGVTIGRPSGEVVWYEQFKTQMASSPESILDHCVSLLKQHSGKNSIIPDAIGICCPGPFHHQNQQFLGVPNMPRWHGFELGKYLLKRGFKNALGMNDANATALAEWKWAREGHIRSLVYLTMATGMGAGLIIDDQLVTGSRGFAGEVGRILLSNEGPVGFGARGTVEGFLSGGGIVQDAQSEVMVCRQLGETTVLQQLCENKQLDTKSLCIAAQDGDPAALRVTKRAAVRLGELAGIIINIIEPDEIVLGTIGSAFPELFVPIAESVASQRVIPEMSDVVHLRPTRLVNKSGQSALAVASYAIDQS